MKDFDELRRLAREKRDAAIDDARHEYRLTLESINDLQIRLLKKPSQKGKPKPLVPMRKKILDAVPVDRTWTVDEVLDWLNLPKTDKNQIRANLTKMIKAGTVKQIRRGKRNVIALFAVAGFESPANDLNGMSQIKAAKTVLAEIGDVDVQTLAVAMVERGYQHSAKDNGAFVKSLRLSLRRNGLH